jgi:peptide/nickel transport system permease protein
VIDALLRRLLSAALTVWLVVTATFLLSSALPADPARLVAGPHASDAVVERLRVELGLDQPLPVQYLRHLNGVLHGDLGRSFHSKEPVTAALARTLPYTGLLALGASLVQLGLGLPAGLLAAWRRGGPLDLLTLGLSLLGLSAPTFLWGLLFMVGLGHEAGLFPLGGAGAGLTGALYGVVLPSLTLGVVGAAATGRLSRGELLEVIRRDHVRTARAKGLSEARVWLQHGLRNAMPAVVTLFALDLGALLGGAVVTESVFAWPGMGKLAIDAVLNQDLPVLMGTVLISSCFIIASNLVADVVNAALDPSSRFS